jgi:hypothetical protein
MALPNGLPQISDVGALLSTLGNDLVDIPLMTPTTVTGTPAAGTFHSTVVNRAPMFDLSKDLSVNMGINRIITQQTYELQNEFGPNGEPIFGALNDKYGQIRFVGNNLGSVFNVVDTFGARVNLPTGNYVEITFYGTGLNVLCLQDSATRQFNAQVNGGAVGANLFPASGSTVLGGRGYSQNTVINVVTGLAIGTHTVRINSTGSGGQPIPIFGFEILNEQFLTTTANINSNNQLTSVANTAGLIVGMDIFGTNIPANTTISAISGNTITMSANATATTVGISVRFGFNCIEVNPGTTWKSGKKLYNPLQNVSLFNSGFESGTLGTRGGRVAVYQKADGSIGKAVNSTNASQLNLTAADHSNEEIARVYNFRELGAARTDDFSTNLSASNRVFTLDDGTTTLVANNLTSQFTNGKETISFDTNGAFLTFTFVGTGLDITQVDSANGGSDSYTLSIDGGGAIALATAGNTAIRTTKLVSGLPYGTHTIRITRVSAATWGLRVIDFKVYQPKTPTIPTDASLIGAYNIMANYSGSAITTGGNQADGTQIPIGVLRKYNSREFVYAGSGTWSFSVINATTTQTGQGFVIFNPTNGGTSQLTFWGTGFVLYATRSSGASVDFSVTVDGALNASGTVLTTSSGTNLGGGSYRSIFNAAQDLGPNRIQFTGLSLGLHTVILTKTAGADNFSFNAFDIITPIHSHKDNGPFVLQNTLRVGSQGISDLRDIGERENFTAVAASVNALTGFTATLPVPMRDMSVAIKTTKKKINISFQGGFFSSAGPAVSSIYSYLYVNGSLVGRILQTTQNSPGALGVHNSNSFTIPLAPGEHKIDVYINVDSGTWAGASGATMVVTEMD